MTSTTGDSTMTDWKYNISMSSSGTMNGIDFYRITADAHATMVDVVDRKDFLSRLSDYGKRSWLKTHPTTKYSQAEFAGTYNGRPATYLIDWFPPTQKP